MIQDIVMKDQFLSTGFDGGKLMQLKEDECKMFAHKIFEYYDSHVRGELGPRQQKTILNDFYRIIGIKNADVKQEELDQLLSLFGSEDKTIKEQDFLNLIKTEFKTTDDQGALNSQMQNRDLIDFDYQGYNRANNSTDLLADLQSMVVRRFGKAFLEDQQRLLGDIYLDCGLNLRDDYPYERIRPIIERINTASLINANTNEYDLGDKEYKRIFFLIDYDLKGSISWTEIQIFYLRGLLGV